MKSLSKFIIAGALAGIFLFVYSTKPSPKPSSQSASAAIINQPAVHNTPVVYTTLPTVTVTAIKKSATHKTATPALQPVTFKKNTNVGKLTKSLSAKVFKADMNQATASIAEVSTEEDNLPEIIVMQRPSENVSKEVEGIAPEKTGGYAYEGTKTEKNNTPFSSLRQPDKGADSYSYMSVYDETEKMKDYAINNGCNSDYALMINLGMKSGKKRFFVIDLASNTIVKSGVVSEGNSEGADKKYSNEIGSTASSLGAYKIGKRVKNEAGFGYKLAGMQESNSNAAKRSMMLQATEDVPYDEINFPVLKTDGSLSLSNRFLTEISPLIDESTKPMLLWVYDSNADSQGLYSVVQKKH